MQAKKANTLEEFIQSMGPYFHTRLMMYHENMVKDEHKPDGDTILNFEFPEGEYSITYNVLKVKADEETLELLDTNGLRMNMGPLFHGQSRIEKKYSPMDATPIMPITPLNE